MLVGLKIHAKKMRWHSPGCVYSHCEVGAGGDAGKRSLSHERKRGEIGE